VSGLIEPVDDLIQPFVIEATSLHGRLIRLGPTVDAILTRHDYPSAVKALLAEFLALTAGLGSALKFEGVFSLQVKGDGPVRSVFTDMTTEGELRGCADLVGEAPPVNEVRMAPVPRLLGAGYMAFTVDQGEHTDLYQGIVELQGATLIECVHHYFQQSEQFSAAVKLATDSPNGSGWRAGALTLQRIPGEEGSFAEEEMQDAWRRATVLMGSCRNEELTDPDLSPYDLLYRLFHEDGVRVFRRRPLSFGCRCSRDRAARILRVMSAEDIEEYLIDGKIIVTCQFCNSSEIFDEAQISALRAS
jgi:molecular chaperone Hsp33